MNLTPKIMQKTITNTQIQGINAKELFSQFEAINSRLDELQQTVKPQSKKLLTRKEVAKLLDISLPTLWTWTNKNILTSYRIGNKVRYKEHEVFAALQQINNNK